MADRDREQTIFGVLHRLAVLLVLSIAAALLPANSAGAGSTNVVTVSGALKGTPKVVPNLNCYSTSGKGGTLGWNHVKLSPRKAASWSITIVAPGPARGRSSTSTSCRSCSRRAV